ncbi:hypothetical protein Bbelb_265320 [Branchiostoma belcheri]|nr:hypothetical protein Bbelb_265320 [Branchiostoma belcheri]
MATSPRGGIKLYYCPRCGKGFASKTATLQHLRGKHEGCVQCDRCGKEVKRTLMKQHLKEAHVTEDNKASEDKSRPTRGEAPAYFVASQTSVTCRMCAQSFGSVHSREQHEREVHLFNTSLRGALALRMTNDNFLDTVRPSGLSEYVRSSLQLPFDGDMGCAQELDKLLYFLKHKLPFQVHRIVRGGSYIKGTDLASRCDVDFVLFVKGSSLHDQITSLREHQKDSRNVLHNIQVSLKKSDMANQILMEDSTPFAIRFQFKCYKNRHMHLVDVMPSFDTLGPSPSKETRRILYRQIEATKDPPDRQHFSVSLMQLQVQFVKVRPACVKDLIRLVKHWKLTSFAPPSADNSYRRLPSSYTLELITIHVWERAGHPINFSLAQAFRAVLQQLVSYREICLAWFDNYERSWPVVQKILKRPRPVVLDPANPTNNLCETSNAWDEVAHVARHSLLKPLFHGLRTEECWKMPESSSGLPGPSGVGSPLHSMLHFFPQGHEKPLKQAFYNTAANLFILFAIGAAVAVYFVLEAFLRPLLWAVLCGTFLYPFKYQITNFVQGWLQSLSDSDTPLAVGVAILPLTAVNYSANLLGGLASRKWKLILGVAFGMPAVYFLYYFGPLEKMLLAVQGLVHAVYHMLGYFSAIWVWTTVIAYLVAVVFWWKPGTSTALKVLSIPVWAVLLLHLATVAGPFRVPLFVAVVTIMVVGFVAELRAGATADILGNLVNTTMFEQSDSETSPQKQPPAAETIRPSSFPDTPKRQSKSSLESTLARKKAKQMPFSTTCILWLVYAIVVVRLWMNLWILELLPIPLSVLLFKKIAVQVSTWELFQTKLQQHKQTAKEWLSISNMLEKSLNALTSTFVILLLLVGTTLLTILLAIQVHKESVHLVNVTSNVLNETLHPDINEWLSDSGGIKTTMDSMMDNAYVYGREWIAAKINDGLSGQPVDKKLIKRQVLEIWDRLYHTWLAKNTTVVSSKLSKHGNMTSSLMSVWHGVSHLGLSEVTSFVQENMSTLMSVLESIWSVLKGNINLALTMVTATISIVFFSGTAILNFVLSTVIFLTTLFYLLSVSENQYKPVEWIVNLFPSPGQGGSTNRLGQTVEEAIRSVFGASLKMAVFYGLYTWLTHTVFGINIVFIPSALAAVFAAVPFVGTYWAALPAVLDLWLVQDKSVLAILLAVCHLIPMSFVDTAIYSEIKGGGHPYLTGLAVAGGIYIAGLEGALIGPILLCCLLVAMNVYSGMIQGSGMTPTSEHGMRTHRGISVPLKRAFSEADQH